VPLEDPEQLKYNRKTAINSTPLISRSSLENPESVIDYIYVITKLNV